MVKIANSNNPAAIDPIVSDLILAFMMFSFKYKPNLRQIIAQCNDFCHVLTNLSKSLTKKRGPPLTATLNPETNTMKKTEHEKNKDTQIIIKNSDYFIHRS